MTIWKIISLEISKNMGSTHRRNRIRISEIKMPYCAYIIRKSAKTSNTQIILFLLDDISADLFGRHYDLIFTRSRGGAVL